MPPALPEAIADPAAQAAMRGMLEARVAAISEGDTAIGWKAAITHPPTQKKLGLQSPLIGYLLQSLVLDAIDAPTPKPGVVLIELELALQLGSDLPQTPSLEQAGDAIASFAPALELLRIDAPLDDLDLIARRNAFHANVRFGDWTDAADFDPQRPLSPGLTLEGQSLDQFDPELVVGAPAEIVRFMAGSLAPFGERLSAGDRIICGSLNKPVTLKSGSETIGRLEGLGEVALRLK